MEKYEKIDKEHSTLKVKRLSSKKKNRLIHHYSDAGSGLPVEIHTQLQSLFQQIEKEFLTLHQENVNLRERVDMMSEKYDSLINSGIIAGLDKTDRAEAGLSSESADGNTYLKGNKKPSASQLMSQKLKTTYKASTSKIASSFKIPNNQGGSIYCQLVKKYLGHRDGIWEVTCRKNGQQSFIGTASADRTARIWNIDSGHCLATYQAHNGSVNSIRFHPTDMLVCTGSGDGSCHIWKLQLPATTEFRSRSPTNGIDSPVGSGDDEQDDENDMGEHQGVTIKTPCGQLSGHEGPIASSDWWCNGTQIFTASWDRTIKLWDVEKSSVIHTLEGHELEITHASAHSVQKLIVTSSSDTTFRLWDFRLPSMHSVNVFQGHTDTVTSAVFTNKADHVVSGSDDRTVKVWDLKNMRSPLATIRLDSAVNRLSLSPTQNIIAIPHDNRHVRLYDLSGNRLSRLPRRHRQGHQRIVCATSWFDDTNCKQVQLLTAGFDKQLLGWNIAL